MNTRQTGRIAALLAASLVVGLVIWSELARRGSEKPPLDEQDIPELPLADTTSDLDRPEGITDLVGSGVKGVWTNADPEFGLIRMTWETLDPKPDGLFEVESPDATITLDDRRITITAEQGTLLWPARGLDQDREPESGTLRGGVTLSVFDGGEPIDGQTPIVSLTTESISFDSTLGEVKTPEAITITSDNIIYSGTGLTLRYSEAPWRLTHLRVNERSEAIFRGDDSSRDGPEDETSRAREMQPPDDKPSQVDTYRLTLRDDVRLRSSIAELEAEEFLVLARLINGELASDAIASFESTLRSERAETDSRDATDSDDPLDEEVRLAWAGPLEIRPTRDPPEELQTEDVHLTIRSPASNRVTLTEMSTGATLRCVSLEYGATTRNLSILGIGGIGVRATLPGQAEAVFGRLDLDLTKGEGSIPGPVRLTSLQRGRAVDDPLELTASDGAIFRLSTAFGPVGAGGIIDPIEVIINGRVEARDERYELRGDAARALFTRRDADSPRQDPRLARVLIEGDARITDETTEDTIAARTLDVILDTDAPDGELVPMNASARVGAVANRVTPDGRESIEADIIEASFSRDGEGNLDVETLGAVGDVIALNDEGVRLETQRLDTNERTGRIDLEGAPIRVTSNEGPLRRAFTADRAQYDRNARTLTVLSAGTASQTNTNPENNEFDAIDTSWQGGMVYDDRSGLVELRDGVALSAQRTGTERHTARADMATIRLSPSAEGGARFLGAELEGFDESSPVTVELRRFAPDTENETQRLANLRGPRIELDATDESIDVTGAGTLLLHDNTPEEVTARNDGNDSDPPDFSARGSTLFEWKESLSFERPRGLADMRGRVRVLHRSGEGREVTQLECERLTALISEPPRGVEGETSLVRVDATDAVYAKHGPVEIVADTMAYLAPSDRLEAHASEGNLVTVRDEREGRHISANAVSLDLETGDWTIEEVAPVTSPR